MEQLRPSSPYLLGENGIEDILAVQAELLRSEGLNPEWPGFDRDQDRRPPD